MEGPSGMEGFSPRIPRPYHTEGSVVVHTVAPGIVTKSDLQQKLDDHQDDHQDNHEDDSGLRGVLPENLPASLYRWYDSNSQGYNSENAFLAGVFCRSAFFDRDEISDDQFRAYFRSHVTKERSTTPFISSFRSPLAPIHRAVHSPEDGKVAIIDSAKLNTKVFYAHPLAKHTDTFTYSWRGYGEFLIWGRIPKDAIIFTLRASQLDQIAHVHKDISRLLQLSLIRKSFRCNQVLRDRLEERRKSAYKSGRTLGKLLSLLQFPRIHWENFARWFAKSWGWCYTEEFVQFMSGLRSELPYLNQELSDSESEEYLVSPQMTPQKLRRGRDPHSPAESDLDYEPPASEEDSDWCSVDQPAATLGTQSVSMDNRSDTVDDGRFSTHETLSSFGLPERVGSGFHGQKKSNLSTTRDKYEVCDEVNDQLVHPEWPSDNETRPTPASPFAVVIIRRADGNIRQ